MIVARMASVPSAVSSRLLTGSLFNSAFEQNARLSHAVTSLQACHGQVSLRSVHRLKATCH